MSATGNNYADFINGKRYVVNSSGREPTACHPSLYDFQRAIVAWAVRRGRAAIFAGTGLGKTRMQLEWARQSGTLVLIVAPLAVAEQTIAEAKLLGIEVVKVARPSLDIPIQITNYQKLQHFVGAPYEAIVLDESSILKSIDGKTRSLLLQSFTDIPSRLCCTATPAPNDIAEMANHAEFLGIMRRVEMLATFFVHDDDGWRLKGHAADAFHRWMATWAVYIRQPSDLGYDDGPFVLPSLLVEPEIVTTEWRPDGMLLPMGLGGVGHRASARRGTLAARVARAVAIVRQSWGECPRSTGESITARTASADSLNPISIDRPTPKRRKRTSATTIASTERPTCSTANSAAPPTQTLPSSDAATITPAIASVSSKSLASISETTSQVNGTLVSKRPTESPSLSSTPSSPNNEDSAQFVTDPSRSEEELDSTSITTTPPAACEGSSVPGATWASASSMTAPNDFVQPLPISKEQWLIWVGLNDEQTVIAKALGLDCVSIQGSTEEEQKLEREAAWRAGKVSVLITKVSQFGFGLNWQHCHNVLFLGLSDSWEQYFQAIRRCWRFGQKQPVTVKVVTSNAEVEVLANIRAKEEQAMETVKRVVEHMKSAQEIQVKGATVVEDDYHPETATGEGWEMKLGDAVERIREIAVGSVALSIYSPPFASLFTYSNSPRDMGNSKDYPQFFEHYGYLVAELARVTMPGRRTAVHCQQVSTTQATHGRIGWRDFRGDIIRCYESHGWVYDGEIVIDKDPQAQAIRTHSKQLLFVQKERDRSWLRPAMADYILLFRAPGENQVPITDGNVSNEEWICWARPIWYGIRESHTLNAAEARNNKDERHICPLQLETIERCIRLWSNPGEMIFSPFAGIGSEGFVALQHERRFVGIELKREYWTTACRNLRKAHRQMSLLDRMEVRP